MVLSDMQNILRLFATKDAPTGVERASYIKEKEAMGSPVPYATISYYMRSGAPLHIQIEAVLWGILNKNELHTTSDETFNRNIRKVFKKIIKGGTPTLKR